MEKETIIKFLKNWKLSRFDKMYQLCQLTWTRNHNVFQLKKLIQGRLKSYEIKEISKPLPCVCDINISLKIKGKIKHVTVRLVQESEPYKTDIKGIWGVNPISLIKNLY